MDGVSIWVAILQMFGTAICVLLPASFMYGQLTQRVKNIERVVIGNGEGLPERCVKHSTQLTDYNRRLEKIEKDVL